MNACILSTLGDDFTLVEEGNVYVLNLLWDLIVCVIGMVYDCVHCVIIAPPRAPKQKPTSVFSHSVPHFQMKILSLFWE